MEHGIAIFRNKQLKENEKKAQKLVTRLASKLPLY